MLVCYLTTTLYECGCIMDISTVLNVKNIKLNMTARTKEEVIEELTDLLIQMAPSPIRKTLFVMSGYARS